MSDATEAGIISEQVAKLWDIHTDTLIKAVELRGYKVLAKPVFDTMIEKNEELAERLYAEEVR